MGVIIFKKGVLHLRVNHTTQSPEIGNSRQLERFAC